MTDRELLQLAAKAAGFASIDFLSQDHWANVYDAEGRQSSWNPLTDDGDALRLAVTVGMDVSIVNGITAVFAATYENSCSEAFGADSYAATRRAIVRTAAELARSKP